MYSQEALLVSSSSHFAMKLGYLVSYNWVKGDHGVHITHMGGFPSLEESLSTTTSRCDLAIATHARKMHKKYQHDCQLEYFS
jgi:hypothetical protein